MSVNPDQAIFDAIVAATEYSRKLGAVSISTQKFIEAFNSHRDRKLCTSLDVAQEAGDCEKIARDCDAEMARLSGIIVDQTHEIERLRDEAAK